MSIINNVTQYITPSTTFNSMVLPFERIDASERPPYAFLAFGTFISFLITLYIFYNEQDHQTPDTPRTPRSKHKITSSVTESKSFIDPNKDKLADKSVEKSVEITPVQKKKNGEKSVPVTPEPEPDHSVNDNDNYLLDVPSEDHSVAVEETMYDELDTDQGDTSCCCSCLKTFYKKNAKTIKWIVVIYQVASLVYTFAYTWRLASEAAPDKGSVSWDNYQVWAKAFAISSHFKSVITTAFVLVSKKFILKQLKGTKGVNAKYDTSVMVYLFCFAISCAFYGVTFFWTHLLPGIVIFCPLVFLGAAGFGIFLGIIYLLGKYVIQGQYEEVEDNKEWDIDWIIWIGGLLCTITAVVCVIVMEATVLYWDKPDLETWMNGVILVFTQRDSKAYMDGISTKTKKLINFIALLL